MAKQRWSKPKLLLAGLWLGAVSITLPRQANAQTLELPRPRQGYYVGGGLHAAMSRIKDDGESLGNWWGMEYTLRAGQMLTEQLGMGLFTDFGGTAKGAESASLGGLSLEGQWAFIDNLSLHGSVGFAVVGVYDDDDPAAKTRGSYGGSYSLSLSYDWFWSKSDLSGGWSLAPQATVRYLPDDPISSTLFTFGVELLYWNGLPSNELDLPAGEGYGTKP